MGLLENFGIQPKKIYHNPSWTQYRDAVLSRGEGKLSSNGTVVVTTGIYTGRSPNDRFFVSDSDSEKKIDWGEINRSLPAADQLRVAAQEDQLDPQNAATHLAVAQSGEHVPLDEPEGDRRARN